MNKHLVFRVSKGLWKKEEPRFTFEADKIPSCSHASFSRLKEINQPVYTCPSYYMRKRKAKSSSSNPIE